MKSRKMSYISKIVVFLSCKNILSRQTKHTSTKPIKVRTNAGMHRMFFSMYVTK